MTSFITYTKGAIQYVTTPHLETQFLDWLASVDVTSSYKRETNNQVGCVCSPRIVHTVKKQEAVVLKLVKDPASKE